MKSADKFLIVIVVGALALVVVTFSIAVMRPKPGYQMADTPEAVANNYFYALQQADYERAYLYLSPTMKYYPASARKFRENIEGARYRIRMDGERAPSLHIDSARITGGRAIVTVQQTSFYAGGLFYRGESRSTFQMVLVRDLSSEAWKILSSDEYQAWCWGLSSLCD